MKITSLEARSYRLPLDPPFLAAWDPRPRTSFSETIVAIHTDAGLNGFAGGAPVPDRELLETSLIGVDPTDTDRVHRICETVDFHGGRNWTVEVAIWDLLARHSAQPLWRYLGGTRDRYPVYQSTGERVSAGERVERVLGSQDAGLKAAKLRFHDQDWRHDLAVVEAARSALGSDFDLMVDANQGWRMPGDVTDPWNVTIAAEVVKALADLDVYWIEEPLPSADLDGYRVLRDLGLVRIAGGEMVRTLSESRRLLEVVDVIQNDTVLAGGITGCRRVAAWAEAADVVWSPHTWTTGLGLLANLHAALAFSTGEYLEMPYDPPAWTEERRDFMLSDPLRFEPDGFLRAPPGPGLGVEPDLDLLERWRVG
ncbi:MAG: mandelate racemase/muconate lactonizing enzyme family protein [Actinomycetota bacterium]